LLHGEGARKRPFSVHSLSGSVDALFEARAADDRVAVPVAGLSPRLPVLLPELGNSIVEPAELGGEDDVVSGGQTVQEIGALLAGPLDLSTDFGKCSHC
jgi:hypothetical protein